MALHEQQDIGPIRSSDALLRAATENVRDRGCILGGHLAITR